MLRWASHRSREARREKQVSRGRRRQRHRSLRLALEILEDRRLLRDWSGPISVDTTWASTEVQRITGDVTVNAGVRLTIEAGTLVQANTGAHDLIVQGTLIARGSAAAPIVFTSVKDDTGRDGLAGTADDVDTGGDGSTQGAQGDWGGIQLAASSTGSELDHVEVRYTGSSSLAAVYVDGPLTLTNSLIRDSSKRGIDMVTSNPTLTGLIVRNNAQAALHADLASNPEIRNVELTGNAVNGLELDGGTLPANAVWDDPDIVYWVSAWPGITVPEGLSLTVAPGQIVKFRSFLLNVSGTLDAQGTTEQPIRFTSYRDDAVGGDTNADGPSTAARGDWSGVSISNTGNAVLDHLQLLYGGSLSVRRGQLTLRNSEVSDGYGLVFDRASPTITNVVLQRNGGAAMTMDLASQPQIRGVTLRDNDINGLRVQGGTLPGDATWDNPDIVYWLDGDAVTVPPGTTLTIAPGQIVKLNGGSQDRNLIVGGTLRAIGTAAQPIIFTSPLDDSAGGDTNNDGPIYPAWNRGSWFGIELQATSTGSILDHVEVRYAKIRYCPASVFVNGGQLTLSHSTILGNDNGPGLQIANAQPVVTDVRFEGNRTAIKTDLASNPTFRGVTFVDNLDWNGVRLEGSVLPGDAVWDDPDVVYGIGSITVPAGTKLTIAPGQVVKSTGKLTVAGTLDARGTAVAPIVFTTRSDDVVGGKTDPSGILYQWGGIEFAAGSRDNILDHIQVLQGGDPWDETGAAVLVTGGELTLSNSLILSGSLNGVLVRDSGQATLVSNVIAGNYGNGLRVESGGTVTAVNNTIDGNSGSGVAVDGTATAPTLTLTNNLITFNSGAGVTVEGSPALTLAYNDVYNPTATDGNFVGLAAPAGQNGNMSADPRYVGRLNGQYLLRADSPAVDSAISAGAPATDFAGLPRYDEPRAANVGGGAIPFYDRGALERPEHPVSDVDLALVSVSAPATGVGDQYATLSWTVQNLGPGVAWGNWQDNLYLSADAAWSPDDLLVYRSTHQGLLGSGQTYKRTGSFTLPTVAPGPYYVLVQTDARDELFEREELVNNSLAAPQATEMSLASLTLGSPSSFDLPGTGAWKLFKYTAPYPTDLMFTANGGSDATNELYVRYGEPPTREAFDYRAIAAATTSMQIPVAADRTGDYYVLFYAAHAPSSESCYVLVRLASFGISQITPNRGSNLGQVTVRVTGAGFDAGTTATLVDSAGQTVVPVTTIVNNSQSLQVTFDLAGRPAGWANLQVTKSDGTAVTWPRALDIVAGSPGRLVTNLVAAGRVRHGRDFVIAVEYSNAGDGDLPAPVMRVAGRGFSSLSLDQNWDPQNPVQSVDLVGVSAGSPAGILPPGAKNRILLYGRTLAPGDEQFQLLTGVYPATPVDWQNLQTTLRPPGLSEADWAAIWSGVAARVGTTWESYQSAIAGAATLLPLALGRNYSLDDVFQLIVGQATADAFPSIRGRLVDADNQPLAGLPIALYDAAARRSYSGTSLNDGTFFVAAVPPGTYTASFPGYVLTGDATVVMPGTGGLDNVTWQLTRGATMAGQVKLAPGGMPLGDVTVQATDDNGHVFGALTDAQGTYMLTGLPAGVYEVRADGTPYTSSIVSGVNVNAGALGVPVHFVLTAGGTLTGLVTGPQGPVADAVVAAWGEDGSVATVVSEDDGTFSLGGLAAQTYTVTASAAGLYSHPTAEIPLAAGATVSGVSLTLLPAGSFTGTVKSVVDGTAVPYLLFSLDAGTETYSGQSDVNGDIPAKELPPGTYTVTTVSDEYMTTTFTTTITAGAATPLAITVAPLGTVQGRVTSSANGRNMAGVIVRLEDAEGLATDTVTDAEGQYQFPELDAGTYTVIVGDWDTPGAARTTVTLDAAHRAATADFSLAVAGVITGHVFAADGATPLAYAQVGLVSNQTLVFSAYTDDAGAYSIIVLQAGTYRLEAAYGGLAFPAITAVAVAGDASVGPYDFQAGTRTVRGAVASAATGQPLADATLVISRADAGFVLRDVGWAMTDAAGNFSLTGVPDGTYRVVAQATDLAVAFTTATVAGGDASVSLSLAAESTLSGTLRDAVTSTVVANATLQLLNPAAPVPELSATSDAAGHYQFSGLNPGTYTLVVSPTDHAATVLPTVVLGAGASVVDVGLDAPTTHVRGTVRNAAGPLPGVRVAATDARGLTLAEAETGADGTYDLATLPAGTFVITAAANGYTPSAPAAVTLATGETVTGFDLSVAPAAVSDPEAPGSGEAHRAPTLDLSNLTANLLPPSRSQIMETLHSLDKADAYEKTCPAELEKVRVGLWLLVGEDGKGGGFKFMAEDLKAMLKALDSRGRSMANMTEFTRLVGQVAENVTHRHTLYSLGELNGLQFTASGDKFDIKEGLSGSVSALQQAGIDIDPAKYTAAGLLKAVIKATNELRQNTPTLALAVFVDGKFEDAHKLLEKQRKVDDELQIELYHLSVGLDSFGPEIARKSVTSQLSSDLRNARSGIMYWKQLYLPEFDKTISSISRYIETVEEVEDTVVFFNKAVAKLKECHASNCTPAPGGASSEGDPTPAPAAAAGDAPTVELVLDVDPSQCSNADRKPPKVDPATPPGHTVVGQTGVDIRTSFDPNDKIGSAAYGPDGFIQPGTLFYEVEFENVQVAGNTIPAQEVFVTDTLDADLDPASVEFQSFGFGNRIWAVPPGLANYSTTLDLRPEGINLLVTVQLEVNAKTRELKATYRSLDPLSMQLPDDIDAGFLPVNNANHDGEGFFSYTVRPKAGLPTGTVITNQASIVFDVNAPILTPETKHMLDRGAPASSVAALAPLVANTFTVTWQGSDDAGGSGVAAYDVYVSDNGGAYTLWQSDTAGTSADFTGQTGHTYRFYSVATDNVGQGEAPPSTFDAETVAGQSNWQNPGDPLDVNGDGDITPSDVLAIINHINSHPVDSSLPDPPASPPPYYNVNGDESIGPADVLMVVNYLNAHPGGAAAGEASEDLVGELGAGAGAEAVQLAAVGIPSCTDRNAGPAFPSRSDDWVVMLVPSPPAEPAGNTQLRSPARRAITRPAGSEEFRKMLPDDEEEPKLETLELASVLTDIAEDIATAWESA